MQIVKHDLDRRKRRSKRMYRAIQYQLEHVFDIHNLRNFTLADTRGLVLAYAGHVEEAEVLAAYAPMLSTRMNRRSRAHILDRVRHFVPDASDVQIRSFDVGGETLHLTVLGGGNALQHADLYRAVTGIRRIFEQERSAA